MNPSYITAAFYAALVGLLVSLAYNNIYTDLAQRIAAALH